MKQNWKQGLLAALTACALFAGSSLAAMAADQSGTVSLYLPTGNKPEIQYETGSSFLKFDGVMPGDTLTQEIQLENKRSETATFYLKVLGQAGNTLLQKLTLEIKKDNQVIYKGNLTGSTTSVYGNMSSANGAKLGQWKAKSTATVTAIITVPKELDNVFVEQTTAITWQIRAEIKGDADGKTTTSRNDDGTTLLDRDTPSLTGGLNDDNTTTITEAEVPLGDDPFTIADNQVPTANLPKTGGGGNPFLQILSLLALAGGAVAGRPLT